MKCTEEGKCECKNCNHMKDCYCNYSKTNHMCDKCDWKGSVMMCPNKKIKS